MSSFIPLNLSEDSAALDAEEHTRELQVEEAFKIFQKALKYQKEKEYEKAHQEYEDLFKVEVVSKDGNAITPTIETLRYLSYRNRGMLVFQELADEYEKFDLASMNEKLFTAIEDMVVALDYAEGDSNLVEVLYEIFHYFENKRLARFTIEYELSKDDEEEDVLSIRSKYLSLHTIRFLTREKDLLHQLHDDHSLKSNLELLEKVKKRAPESNDNEYINEKMSFIKRSKDDFIKLKAQNSVSKELEIVLDELSYSSLVQSVSDVIFPGKQKNRISTSVPSYKHSERVFFKFPETLDNTETCKVERHEEDFEKHEQEPKDSHELAIDPGDNAVDFDIISDPPETSVFDSPASKDVPERDDERIEGPQEKLEDLDHDAAAKKNIDCSEKSKVLVSGIQTDTEVKTQSISKESESTSQPLRSSRFRKKSEEQVTLSRADLVESERFISHLNAFLKLVGAGVADVTAPYLEKTSSVDDMPVVDLRKCLINWTPKFSESLAFATSDKSHVPLVDIFHSTIFDESDIISKNIDEISTPEGLKSFLNELNSQPKHISQVIISIIEFFLGETNDTCLIIDSIWPIELMDAIKDFLVAMDYDLHEWIRKSLSEESDLVSLRFQLSICISHFELLVNSSIEVKNKINSYKRTPPNELKAEDVMISSKIDSWSSLIDDFIFVLDSIDISRLLLRYKWTIIFFKQNALPRGNTVVSTMLNDIQRDIDNDFAGISISYANYEYIPRLSSGSINSQLSKISVMSTFATILNTDGSIGETSEAIYLLEKILISEKDIKCLDFEPSILKFLQKSSIDLLLRLWNILLNYYQNNEQLDKFQHGSERVLRFLLEQLKSEKYQEHTEDQRQIIMLKVVGFYGAYADGFLKSFSLRNWKIQKSDGIFQTLKHLIEFLRILFVNCLNEEASGISNSVFSLKSKFPRSFRILKDIFVNTLSVIFIYYYACLPTESILPENINDMLSIMHEYMGVRQFCDAADGYFLKMCQDILLELNWDSSDKDIAQVISCRYHYNISMENFTPFDHNTKKIDLGMDSVYEIAAFVLPICFKKKNPLFNVPKSDLKSLLDGIYEVIGDPSEKDEVIQRNTSNLESFIESLPLSMKNIRYAFHGILEIDLPRPDNKNQILADAGLYYLEGLMALSLYKTRKKTLQGRSVELGAVIKMLKLDLVCGSNRIESWLLLAQTYGYLVEDDLIWTSDKLNGDRKSGTAILQKTSLICYLMAISELIKKDEENKKNLKEVASVLMGSFSKELYNAYASPMSMLCFKVHSVPKFVKKNQGASFEKMNDSYIKEATILKIISFSIKLAIQTNSEDWSNYYYLSKTQHKLEEEPTRALDTLIESCGLAKKASVNTADPIIEPHYRLCSLLLKLVKTCKISLETAINYLHKDPIVLPEPVSQVVSTKQEFSELIVSCLKRILQYDKRKWHHKPRFRLAKIYFEDLGLMQKAKEEMLNLITIKTANKGLAQIWKPENERPGKHFIYTFDYVTFFTTIVTEMSDLESLVLMLPKLRRAGSAMISLYKAWEHTCSSICRMVRKLTNTSEDFTDKQISQLIYSLFTANSRQMVEILKEDGIPDEIKNKLCMLSEVTEMKRLNNGFGPTALIDDTYIALFLKIYLHFKTRYDARLILPPSFDQQTPTVNKTKVAKRDFFPFGNDLLKTFRKEIDQMIKEQPEIIMLQDPPEKCAKDEEQIEQGVSKLEVRVLEKIEVPPGEEEPENKNGETQNIKPALAHDADETTLETENEERKKTAAIIITSTNGLEERTGNENEPVNSNELEHDNEAERDVGHETEVELENEIEHGVGNEQREPISENKIDNGHKNEADRELEVKNELDIEKWDKSTNEQERNNVHDHESESKNEHIETGNDSQIWNKHDGGLNSEPIEVLDHVDTNKTSQFDSTNDELQVLDRNNVSGIVIEKNERNTFNENKLVPSNLKESGICELLPSVSDATSEVNEAAHIYEKSESMMLLKNGLKADEPALGLIRNETIIVDGEENSESLTRSKSIKNARTEPTNLLNTHEGIVTETSDKWALKANGDNNVEQNGKLDLVKEDKQIKSQPPKKPRAKKTNKIAPVTRKTRSKSAQDVKADAEKAIKNIEEVVEADEVEAGILPIQENQTVENVNEDEDLVEIIEDSRISKKRKTSVSKSNESHKKKKILNYEGVIELDSEISDVHPTDEVSTERKMSLGDNFKKQETSVALYNDLASVGNSSEEETDNEPLMYF